jgi:hypothetical protein
MERTRIGYTFDEKKYYQRKLLIGQIRQLAEQLQGVKIDFTDPVALVTSLGDKLPRSLAIVLIPEGTHPKEKDPDAITALAAELEFALCPDDAMQVVDDFFSLNDPYSFLIRFRDTAKAIEERLRQRTAGGAATGSTNSSPSLPEETSPAAT